MNASGRPRRGVKTKLLGVVLLIVGTMDSMLSWRGGLVVNDFYVFLLVAGITLYIIGAIRQGRGT